MKNNKKAFTLIELLVVITIIALLVSIVMPALNKAKQQATMVVCLSGQKQLVMAYSMYANENNDFMVRPSTANGKLGDWVHNPIQANGNDVANPRNCTKEEEIRGIQKGALYKYYKEPELVHCPGDKRSEKAPQEEGLTGDGAYRTYSIIGTLNPREWGAGTPSANRRVFGNAKTIQKFSSIKIPQDKIVFIEEGDYRGCNLDEWLMDFTQSTTAAITTTDPIGMFHNNKGTFSFADGHADVYQWKSKVIIEEFSEMLKGMQPSGSAINRTFSDAEAKLDYQWLVDHTPHAGLN